MQTVFLKKLKCYFEAQIQNISPRVKTFPLNTLFGGLQSIFPGLIFSSESHELIWHSR